MYKFFYANWRLNFIEDNPEDANVSRFITYDMTLIFYMRKKKKRRRRMKKVTTTETEKKIVFTVNK